MPDMPGTPREQLAAVARTADDLDAILDKLFANVAELKAVLGRARAQGDQAEGNRE
jgi:hypothetical protein